MSCTPSPVPDDYAPLKKALDFALDQAMHGKGAERHANGKPYMEQPMITLGNHFGYKALLFQVSKKALETPRIKELKGTEAALRELAGLINYAASAMILLEQEQQEKLCGCPVFAVLHPRMWQCDEYKRVTNKGAGYAAAGTSD